MSNERDQQGRYAVMLRHPYFLHIQIPYPMGGRGCLGGGLPSGKYMLWFAESIWY